MDFQKFLVAIGQIRYVSIVAVVSAGFGSILMFVLGSAKIYYAYAYCFESVVEGTQSLGVVAKQAIAYLVQGIDAFLIALVFLIFSGGVYNIFVRPPDRGPDSSWSHTDIRSFSQLKIIIAELIVIILFVSFMEDVLGSDVETYQWQILVIPVSILLLSLSIKFLGEKHAEGAHGAQGAQGAQGSE